MSPIIERLRLATGSRTISYLAAGAMPSDRVAVFLHAFPLNAEMWAPQLSVLPRVWAEVAPDFRGFGGSTPDDGGVPRAGHLSNLESPDTFNAAMHDWLAAVSGASV